MTDADKRTAVELLQELGLKEYEASCLAALVGLPDATAREISDVSEVPRTRVYDAIRVLEAKGLVEVQHTNPQRFRAVPVDEAVATIRDWYDSRVQSLERELRRLQSSDRDPDVEESPHEVWSLASETAITNRLRQLVEPADAEVHLVVAAERFLPSDVLSALDGASDRGASVSVGVPTASARERIDAETSGVETYVSRLEWLEPEDEREPRVGRMLMVDEETILVSTLSPDGDGWTERAVFGKGFHNGLVVLLRGIMSAGILDESSAECAGSAGCGESAGSGGSSDSGESFGTEGESDSVDAAASGDEAGPDAEGDPADKES